VLRYYKNLGYYIYLHTGDRGYEVFKNCPHVDEFIPWNGEVPIDKLGYFWEELKTSLGVDEVVNLTQSIETNICLVDKVMADYVKSREELWHKCNKNFYEETLLWAKIPLTAENIKPELFFSKQDEKEAKSHLDWSKFNIVCCLKASTSQRLYPHLPEIINWLYKEYGELVNVITVGDKDCVLIEELITRKAKKLSGRINPMTSFSLTKYSNLVIATDTGTLHASGCFKTPKIGLLGSTTIENITKHFENDYSIEADRDMVSCSPCFKIISDINKWCQMDEETGTPRCMSHGIPIDVVKEQIVAVLNKWRKRRGL
jgi:ADP-heptose:LPS heptosyltransferase